MPASVKSLEISREAASAARATAAAVGCARRGRGGWRTASAAHGERFFDLASVTKPLTAVAIARVSLLSSEPLGRVVEEARGTASDRATVELLLAHRAGLCSHLPLFEPLTRGEAVDRAAILRTAADSRREDARDAPHYGAEGFAPVYSDMGYVLVGEALARRTGARDAGEAIAEEVIATLGLAFELGTARELAARGLDMAELAAPTEDVAWRGGVVRGRVHDENAWALTALGGSGHAGLFGTAEGVVRFGCAVLDGLAGRGELGGVDLSWLVRERPGGTLRAGFDGKSEEGSSAGSRLGPRSFGHLGFTGTSLWIDPDAEIVVALLTNRVHPTRENVAIRAARPAIHDALVRLALAL